MKIIEIRQTSIGEVAYVYEEQTGKIVKVLIEDRTGYGDEEEVEDVLPVYTPSKRIIKRVQKRLIREEEPEEVEEEVKEDVPLGPPKMAIVNDELIVTREPLAKKTKGNIMPAGIRSVFLPHDTPGSAIEKRNV
jgi:hypothetical protein